MHTNCIQFLPHNVSNFRVLVTCAHKSCSTILVNFMCCNKACNFYERINLNYYRMLKLCPLLLIKFFVVFKSYKYGVYSRKLFRIRTVFCRISRGIVCFYGKLLYRKIYICNHTPKCSLPLMLKKISKHHKFVSTYARGINQKPLERT